MGILPSIKRRDNIYPLQTIKKKNKIGSNTQIHSMKMSLPLISKLDKYGTKRKNNKLINLINIDVKIFKNY